MKKGQILLTAGSLLPALALVAGGCATQPKAKSKAGVAAASEPTSAQLAQRVTELEKQVKELSEVLEPLKAQQSAESRRKALRARFDQKMAQDRAKYTQEQLGEAEKLYQVANQKWGTPEATDSLHAMMEKYPDINRTGCATLYVAQNSSGEDRTKYLQQCIEKYNDCFYGDGVQVGAYARYLLAGDYQSKGEEQKAQALYRELKAQYPDAVDHGGNSLLRSVQSPK
jgi:hypothetical protein